MNAGKAGSARTEFHRVLVTGASGCIGRCIVQHSVAEGCQVNALDLDGAGLQRIAKSFPEGAVIPFVGGLEDGDLLTRAAEGVEAVFHAAAKVHSIPRDPQEEAGFFEVNVEGTENLLRHLDTTNLRAFVLFSTIAVYGAGDGSPLTERSPLNPENAYARSKLESEQRVGAFFAARAIKPVIFRMALVYGEGERGNFSRMMRSVDAGRFVMVGGGRTRKSMIYVGDVARAALLAAGSPAARGETFVLSDPEPYALRQVTAVLARHLVVRAPWVRLPASLLRAGGSVLDLLGRGFGSRLKFSRDDVDKLLTDTVCDVKKIRTTLGFEPHYGLEEGVRRTVQWYREQQARAGEVG